MPVVKLTNDILISQHNLQIGIDTNNMLASGAGRYTAGQLSWVVEYCWGTPNDTFYVDGNSYGPSSNGANYDSFHTILLPKGSTFEYNSSHSWRAYGCK